jgi:hypothetical protein
MRTTFDAQTVDVCQCSKANGTRENEGEAGTTLICPECHLEEATAREGHDAEHKAVEQAAFPDERRIYTAFKDSASLMRIAAQNPGEQSIRLVIRKRQKGQKPYATSARNLVKEYGTTTLTTSPKSLLDEGVFTFTDVRAGPETYPARSCTGFSRYPSGPIASDVGGNRNETLDGFIEALQHQDTESNPDFLDLHEIAYDQAFRIFFHSKCNCTSCRISEKATEWHILTRTLGSGENGFEVNEPEHTCSLRESVQYLQNSLPPLPTIFGEAGSYDPGSFFRQWRDFLSNKPSHPLSFRKSQIQLLPATEPELVLSRQWDIDSIWFGATGLQVIRPPNNFRLSFLPSLALNLSCDEVIQPHGLDLAKTRHIRFGTFNTHSVHFSAFVFFPCAAPDSTSATRNALSLERQKDLYDHIIIPAACEAVSDPCRQEIPRTYDIAYAKSRSFQEKPGNNRWRPDDVNRAVHLQYTIPAEDLPLFWTLVVSKANAFQLTTKGGETVPYFKGPRLLFQSHDLKNTFGKETLNASLEDFECTVLQALDPAHLDIHSCWIDIGARDFVASGLSHSHGGQGPVTVLWKSQCHSHLHEQISRIAPESHLNAVKFQRFLLRDIGDYQVKAKRTRATSASTLVIEA